MSPLTAEDGRNVQKLEEWYKNDNDAKDCLERVEKKLEELTTTVRQTKSLCGCPICEPIRRYHRRARGGSEGQLKMAPFCRTLLIAQVF